MGKPGLKKSSSRERRRSVQGYAVDASRRKSYYAKTSARTVTLNVDVVEARDLHRKHNFKARRASIMSPVVIPQVELSMGEVDHVTSVYGAGGSHPKWKEVFCFPEPAIGNVLSIAVIDKTTNSALGTLDVEINEQIKSGEVVDKWYILTNSTHKGAGHHDGHDPHKKGHVTGELRIMMHLSEQSIMGEYRRPPSTHVMDHTHTSDEVFDFRATLGQSDFSVVKKGWIREEVALEAGFPDLPRQQYAIKIISNKAKSFVHKQLKTEVSVLSTIDHPKCVVLHAVINCKDSTCLLTNLVEGLSLYTRLAAGGKLQIPFAKSLTRQLVDALVYLHNKKIVYRNLKPENIIFETKEDGDDRITLVDFGTATFYDEKGKHKRLKVYGSPEYFSPEVAQYKAYDHSTDMWGLGVVVYVMLCGYNPFETETEDDTFENLINGWYLKSDDFLTLPGSAQSFIDQLLKVDPRQRLTAEMAMEHPFLKSDGIMESLGL